ncbi:MAG: FadR/GntR family transcriptional regulator [Rectinema sp.]
MEFGKIEREGVSEKIIEYVKQQIINGNLKPGDRLPAEDALAVQMGVGRGTIREALKVLSYTGFLEKKNNRTYVSGRGLKGFDNEDVTGAIHRFEGYMEIIEVRRVLEPELAALAAARATPEIIAELRKTLTSMENWQDDADKFSRHDNDFHLILSRAANNTLFSDIMKSIQKVMRDNLARVIRSSKIAPRSLEYHKRIYEAIKIGDAAKARRATLSHILDVEKEMRILYNKEKGKEI